MAVIDVTQNGVTFNDQAAAAANANAIVDICETTANAGDIVDFPFSPGDQCWVEGDNPNNDGEPCIDMDVNSGLAQNLTLRGRMDANNEPVGEIIIPGDIGGFHYLFEVHTRDGLSMDVRDLRLDHNESVHNAGGVCAFMRDQTTGVGATNNIRFINCYFEDARDVNVRTRCNGTYFEHCTFDLTSSFHCLTFDQDVLNDTEAQPRGHAKNCLMQNATRLGVNHSAGLALIEDCVIQNCGLGGKIGNESDNPITHDVTWRRVRVDGLTADDATCLHAVAESTPLDSTITLDDVVLDQGNGGIVDNFTHGIWSSDEITFNVPTGSTLIVKNATDDGLYIRHDSVLDADGATVKVCDNENAAIDYDSAQNSTIGTLDRSGNPNDVENNGNLLINNENTGVACGDLANVPQAADVGVGTHRTIKRPDGDVWASVAGVRRYDGTSFIDAPVKAWDGSQFVNVYV